VLEYTGNNRRQAALLLGVARSTLLAKIRKYGL
jgi:DNA-binding protein Fis